MTLVVGEAPVAAIAGVLVGLLVIAGLIYGAISQYRTSQAAIAEKRRRAAEEQAAERERAATEAREAAGPARSAFEAQRRRVREERPALVGASRGLLADLGARWTDTTLLVPDAWLLPHPVHLAPGSGDLRVQTSGEPGQRPVGAVRGAFAAAAPPREDGTPYPHVVDAIKELEAPAPSRYVDRDCYRPRSLRIDDGRVELLLDRTTYFALLDEAVPLECELAAAASRDPLDPGAIDAGPPLPLRAVLGDPFDLAARTGGVSIDTLVERRAADGTGEFWLHRRRAVGMVGGQTHVVPAGVFQPAVDGLDEVFERDAEPWHAIMRELAEELLGVWDADSRALAPDAYETEEPLRSLEAARRGGTVRPWLVGLGLDPLSLWLELLAVLVIDAETFDTLVGEPPRENGEGTVLGRTRPDGSHGGHPFTAAGLDEALADPALAPAADGLLRLAARHRETLLAEG
ncbi:MAG: hypothetical protein AAGC46_16895 [Solirubrobacteraceae bacterium]